MKVLVSEYVLSTFNPNMDSNYFDLLPEAYAITSTLANSLRFSRIETYLTISNALTGLLWDNVIYVDSEQEYYDLIKRLKNLFDWVILIAPPRELIKVSKIIGEKLLGPPVSLIELFSDKYLTQLALENIGIKTPRTMLVESGDATIDHLRQLNPPYVVKPVLLAGSECVYFVENENEVLKYVELSRKCDPSGKAIVQEYINGVHGSISVIYGKNEILFYSVNLQLVVRTNNRLKYTGGVLPVRNRVVVNEAETIIHKLLESYPMLRGYIGLDVVWNNKGIFVVEVNPRFTTSIIGINEIYPNVGELIVESMLNSAREKIIEFLGDLSDYYAYYYITDEPVSAKSFEKTIGFPSSKRVILVGKDRSKTSLLNRVQKLLSRKKLVYELNYAI